MLYKEGVSVGEEETFWQTKIGNEYPIDIAKRQALDFEKEIKIQLIKAKERGIKLEKSDYENIDAFIDTFIQQSGGTRTTAGQLSQALYGVTLGELERIYKDIVLASKYMNVRLQEISVTDEDIQSYYEKNPDKFKNDTEFREDAEEAVWARHILFKTIDENGEEYPAEKVEAIRKEAEEVLKRAKSGEDFVELVKEFSEDGSAPYGGDYVFGRGKMDKAFEEAAFSLQPGEISDLVKSQFGYHIIKVEEKIAKDQPVSLRIAKEYREYGPYFVKFSIYDDELNELKNQYQIEINQKVYDSIK